MEQGPADVLAKLQRKEITLFRAAEILNVTVTTLANYLSTMRQGDNPLPPSTNVNASERSTFRVDVTSESDREDVSDEEDENNDETDISPSSNVQSQPSKPDIKFVPTSGNMSKINNLNGN